MIHIINTNISPITALPGLLAENRPDAVNNLVEVELPVLSNELETWTDEVNQLAEDLQNIAENAINAISLETIEDLATYNGNGLVIVKDAKRGGNFVSKTAVEINPHTGSLYVANGGTVFAKLGGGFWARQYSGLVNIRWFNVKGDGETDDTMAIKNLVNYCISSGNIIVNNELEIFITEDIPNIQEIVFVGNGVFIGVGSKKARQVKTNDISSKKPSFGFDSSELVELCRATIYNRPLNVVIVGDSLTTKTVDVKSRDATQYDSIVRAFQEQNPTIDFNFKSRGIGGQTFSNLNTTPSMFPDWYTNTSKMWLDYVEDELPDIVIVSMGMNGTLADSNPSLLLSILNKIKAFVSKPGVIFCTTPLPSSYDSNEEIYNTYCTDNAQSTRQGSAGLVRNFCRINKLPYFDVNRQFNLLRNGFDIRKSYIKMLSSNDLSGSFSNGKFVSPKICRDFSLVVTMAGLSPYTTSGQTLALRVGSSPSEVVLITAVLGKLNLTFYDKESSLIKNITYNGTNNYPTIEIPNVPHTLVCECYDSKIRIYPTTATTDSIPIGELTLISGEECIPTIGTYETNFSSGNVTGLLEFGIGENYKYFPELNNREMYGSPDGSIGLKSPTGGNGVNHFTSRASHKLYYDTFMMSNLDIKSINIETEGASSANWVKYKNGRIEAMGGRTNYVVGASANIDITFPYSLENVEHTLKTIMFSAGTYGSDGDAAARALQHTIVHGEPTNTGCWANLQSLNYTTTVRYATWRLDIIY